MQLFEALRIRPPVMAAIVGGGGKTTTLFQLARQLPAPVIVTTTTHLAATEAKQSDRHFIIQTEKQIEAIKLEGVVLLTGPEVKDERLGSLGEVILERVKELAVTRGISLLVEADGSRQLPIKAPAEYEPVIPAWVDLVIVCTGMSGVGKPLNSGWVHRPERFNELTGLSLGSPVTPGDLVKLLSHRLGGQKKIPPGARRVALLNQADTPALQAQAKEMSGSLLPAYDLVIAASLGLDAGDWAAADNGPIYAAYSRVAGIILAGGESRRMGASKGVDGPKQMLDWFGKPMVRQVAETALQSGLSPVVVVTGAAEAEVRYAVKGLPVVLTHNPDWNAGQSTSLQAGLKALPASAAAAVFMLADQPQIPATLLTKLLEIYSENPAQIIAPLVDGQRANPVLFDRLTFPELMQVKGDVGGRAVFSKFRVAWIPWHDARLLMDVDTPQDYQALLDAYS